MPAQSWSWKKWGITMAVVLTLSILAICYLPRQLQNYLNKTFLSLAIQEADKEIFMTKMGYVVYNAEYDGYITTPQGEDLLKNVESIIRETALQNKDKPYPEIVAILLRESINPWGLSEYLNRKKKISLSLETTVAVISAYVRKVVVNAASLPAPVSS
ncbi:hypothetical protein HQ544_02560 [Candidatus Falkowbacteria bacterium]|nr:hypothetical protein [Candidatus Falkowbacteria bacterium]